MYAFIDQYLIGVLCEAHIEVLSNVPQNKILYLLFLFFGAPLRMRLRWRLGEVRTLSVYLKDSVPLKRRFVYAI